MAKRQSLKELQERLAQRLSVARSEAVAATWLAIESGGRRFLLPLVQSGEIFPVAPVQRVPYTKDWFVGVANLRGGLNGVVDLAQLMGLAAPADASERTTSESRLISLHAALGLNAVLWIDRLLGLRSPGQFSAIEDRSTEDPPFITRALVDSQGQRWQEIDLQQLVSEPGFLSIAA